MKSTWRAAFGAGVVGLLLPITVVAAAGPSILFDYECGGDAVERTLSEPYEMKATRAPGETDAQVANRIANDLETVWAVIPDCPECPTPGACAPKAELEYTSVTIVPNPEEPDVIVKYHGAKAILSCTSCPQ